MAPTTVTYTMDALLSTTLNNYQKTLVDNVSTSSSLLWFLMNKVDGGYEGVEDIGDRMQLPLMTALAQADTYKGYDPLNTQPTEGITTAYYEWFQAAVPVTISGLEEKKNSGEARLVNLLESKVKQSELGIKDLLAKMIVSGNGVNSPLVAGQIMLQYTSPNNNSIGPDPLFRLLQFDPTSNTAANKMVGAIDQSAETFWRNLTEDWAAITTYKQLLAKLRHSYKAACAYNHGKPTLFLSDMTTAELYENALAELHQNPSYQKADIPFDAVQFKGLPWMWDIYFPEDVKAGLQTDAANPLGAITMLNLDHIKWKYHKGTNFVSTPFEKAPNQDAKIAQIMYLGGVGMDNRRSQTLIAGIPRTLA
jgi:hypothetical protein